MDEVNHARLLDEFDSIAFKEKIAYISLKQAIVNYYRLKHENSSLTEENFEEYFPEGASLTLVQFRQEENYYKVSFNLDRKMFIFSLNDKLFDERHLLFLEKDDIFSKGELLLNQTKDFLFLIFNLENEKLLNLWNAFFDFSKKDKLLKSSRSQAFYKETYNIYAYDYFSQVFDFLNKDYDYFERDRNHNGIPDRFDREHY